MTDLLTTDHADSGEIPAYDTLGIEATRDLRMHRRDTTGEATENLNKYLRGDAPFPPLRKVIEIDDTVAFRMPETIGVVDLEGPQKPPPPLPKPKYDPETAVLSLLGSVAGVDGELRMAPLPRPIPDGMPPRPTPPKPSGYEGRHRDPQDRHAIPGEGQWGRLVEAAKPQGEPKSARVFVGVSAFVALAAAVTFVVLVVFW